MMLVGVPVELRIYSMATELTVDCIAEQLAVVVQPVGTTQLPALEAPAVGTHPAPPSQVMVATMKLPVGIAVNPVTVQVAPPEQAALLLDWKLLMVAWAGKQQNKNAAMNSSFLCKEYRG